MQNIFSEAAVSISELKKNPSRILAEAAGAPVALLEQDRVMAYLVPATLYEQILERLDDFELASLAKARAAEIPSRFPWKTCKQQMLGFGLSHPVLCPSASECAAQFFLCYDIQR